MLQSIVRWSDGSITSEDEDGKRRTTSMTIFNMCKRIGFPRFFGESDELLEAYCEGKITVRQYLDTLLKNLNEIKEQSIRPL